MHKITFADGYTVTISETEISVSGIKGAIGKKHDPLYLRDVEAGTEVGKFLIKSGKSLSDYLCSTGFIVRGGNGVREAVLEMTKSRRKKQNAERIEREARFLAEREKRRATICEKTPVWEAELAALIAKIPADGVRVGVVKTGHFDGYDQFSESADGIALKWSDTVCLGSVGFLGDGECGFTEKTVVVSYI